MKKERNLTSASLFRFMCLTAFLFPIAGCNMTDPMIQEMETAYAAAMRKDGDTHEERKTAATQAVQKYFRHGMKAEEAFKLLLQMKADGFEITEYRHEGTRVWPNGDLKPFIGEVGKLTYQRRHPRGRSEFVAQKQYGRQLLIVTKHVVIKFRVIDGSDMVSEVVGDIWANGI